MKERIILLFNRRSEFYQWFLHNIIFGLAGVWMPFVVLMCFGKWRIKEVFTDGTLLCFCVTVSAVSLGFFFKETRVGLRKAYTLTYAALMLTMILSVLGLTALFVAPVFAASTPPIPLNMPFIYSGTVILVFMAVFSNFRLFMAELTSVDIGTIDHTYNAPADKITAAAKAAHNVGDVRL